jgi:hypothetical protein
VRYLTLAAGFGDQDVYPTLLEKAAVLVERIAASEIDADEIVAWLERRTSTA